MMLEPVLFPVAALAVTNAASIIGAKGRMERGC